MGYLEGPVGSISCFCRRCATGERDACIYAWGCGGGQRDRCSSEVHLPKFCVHQPKHHCHLLELPAPETRQRRISKCQVRLEACLRLSGGFRPYTISSLRVIVLCERTLNPIYPALASFLGVPLPAAAISPAWWHFQEASHLGWGRRGPRCLHHPSAGQVHLQRHVRLPGQESAGCSRPKWRDTAPRGHYRFLCFQQQHSTSYIDCKIQTGSHASEMFLSSHVAFLPLASFSDLVLLALAIGGGITAVVIFLIIIMSCRRCKKRRQRPRDRGEEAPCKERKDPTVW